MKTFKFIRILITIPLLMTMMYTYSQSDFPYKKPTDDVLALADAKPAPTIRMNHDASVGLLLYRNAFKSIDELSALEIKLAGIRVNPLTNSSNRTGYFINANLLDVKSGKENAVLGLPKDAKMTNFIWSNDQSKIAFTNTTTSGLELWFIDLKTSKASRLTGPVINDNIGNSIIWSKDNASIMATTLLKNRKPLIDTKVAVPTGPVISENVGQKAQNRTYQDLLKNPADEQNFETLVTSEISKIDLNGKISLFRPAAMYVGMSFSPDGNYLLVYELKKPFSYIVTWDRFPYDIQVLDKTGKYIKTVLSSPLIEELPKGFMAVKKGPRNLGWRSDKAATISWVEALDEGDPEIKVDERDAVYVQNAPFADKPTLIAKTKERYAGIIWGNDQVAVLVERWYNTRNMRTLVFNPSDINQPKRLFNERNFQDNYSSPGSFVTSRNQFQLNTLEVADNHVFLIGEGFSPEGKHPFIDKYDLKDFKKERIYHNKDNSKLEEIMSAIDVKKGIYLSRLESKSEFPNFFIRNITTGTIKQITKNENPFKILDNAHKEVIKYKRPDGVDLSATLYLPVGYDKAKKQKLPMIMWAYPTEFKDKASAGQVTANVNEFTAPNYGSPLYWLTKGYAVLDDAAFPIIGEGTTEPNDTYVPQLVANAKAAIDAVDDMGYIDRSKVAVGGHSYGAFMTANLLTHSDLFAAGIARSGAYNRTLTPFGFQSEQRNYWEAPEVYDAMSPFQNADKMKSPLLMIHGEEDNNAGTHTMQSERYFNALKGLGATARLVLLPKESHGYSARESILHMLWEQDQWLEKYVKNRKKDIKP